MKNVFIAGLNVHMGNNPQGGLYDVHLISVANKMVNLNVCMFSPPFC